MPASSNHASLTHAAPDADPGSDPLSLPDAAGELDCRRSLRTSRTRRAATALRRRRVLRSRRSLLGAAVGLVVLSAGAWASTGGGVVPSTTAAPSATGLSTQTIQAAQQALGVAADGVAGPQTRRATRRFQRTHKLEVDGVLGPQTLAALGVTPRARTARGARPGAGTVLERIAQCESGGDPTAVSASGVYRGKYQFNRKTWRSVGGKGDPAAASEAEQDQRAASLMARAGTSPWPNCG
jgi:hypothetical protein